MEKLRWLMTSFGFSIRQVADLLDNTPAFIHHVLTGKRSLGAQSKETLDHPLFTPYPIEIDEKDLTWADPDRAWRLQEMSFRRLKLQNTLVRVEKKLEEMKSRHLALHKLLHHTSHLPFTPSGGESLVLKWWILQRAKADYALQAFTQRKLDKLRIEKTIIKAELDILTSWLD